MESGIKGLKGQHECYFSLLSPPTKDFNIVWLISLGSCDLDDIITQGHVIMMSQPQSIYQKVIDKTKGLAFQAQFLAQSIDKRLTAQATISKGLPPTPVGCSGSTAVVLYLYNMYTVKPPNKGHVGTGSFVLYREVSFIWRSKCTGVIGIGTIRFAFIERCSLFGVSFIGGSTVYIDYVNKCL